MTKRDKREQAIRRNPKFPGIVTVSPHGATVKPYQVKQAIAALDVVQAEEDAS